YAARLIADGALEDFRAIGRQEPNPDTGRSDSLTSYHDRFVPWMSDFPVAMEDRWFPGPVSHPYPGVSSCRTDPAFQTDPRLPLVGLPDCQDTGELVPLPDLIGTITEPALGTGLSTDTLPHQG